MKSLILLAFITLSQARFSQEQLPINAIREVAGGPPGVSDTIAGAAISDLLAAADPCAKLQRGDQILEELGEDDDAVAAARGMVAAEKNFNPFVASVPIICDDPTLPQNPLLKGIAPLIDPAVGGADVANDLATQTVTQPIADADGKSVADLLSENGFTNFTVPGGNSNSATPVQDPSKAVGTNTSTGAEVTSAAGSAANTCTCTCGAKNTAATSTTSAASAATTTASAATGNDDKQGAGNANGNAGAGNASGTDDFGSCDPTMSFEAGRAGRKATEFTFQSNDPVIAANQQDALNPNIITNRICDQLTNICSANAAAKATCLDAKAQISVLGTRDQSTADAWNALIAGGSTRRSRRRF